VTIFLDLCSLHNFHATRVIMEVDRNAPSVVDIRKILQLVLAKSE
jgi:hypothetical protein